MSENRNDNNEEFSIYIKSITNQELKVILLKLKNEIKKPDVSWEEIKTVLIKLKEKDINIFKDIMPILLND
jgi:hypothetical protein